MKKNLLILLVFLISGMNAYAITPQKYCESLAASSCEVLNVEVFPSDTNTYGKNSVVVKYCRNRVFKLVRYKTVEASANEGANGNMQVYDSSNSTFSLPLSNSACGYIP